MEGGVKQPCPAHSAEIRLCSLGVNSRVCKPRHSAVCGRNWKDNTRGGGIKPEPKRPPRRRRGGVVLLAAAPLFIGFFNPGSDGTSSLIFHLFSLSAGRGKARGQGSLGAGQGAGVGGTWSPLLPFCLLREPEGKAGEGSAGESSSDVVPRGHVDLKHHVVLLHPGGHHVSGVSEVQTHTHTPRSPSTGIFLSLSPLPRLGLAFEGLPMSSVPGGGVAWWRSCCALPCGPSRFILLRLFYFSLLPNGAAVVLRVLQLVTAPKAGGQQGQRESSIPLLGPFQPRSILRGYVSLGTAPVWLGWLQRGHFGAYRKPRDFS